jgi:hypothetical protein
MNSGELLERSLAYALGSVAGVEAGSLGRGTPCAGWDLGELLGHSTTRWTLCTRA